MRREPFDGNGASGDNENMAPGLQLDEDLRFLRRSWRAERVGWALMSAAVAAALLGLLGPGPLSRGSAGSAESGLSIEYGRLERHEAAYELRLQFAPGASSDGRLRLKIGTSYLEKARLQRVDPEPESVIAAGESTTFVFKTAAGGQQSRVVLRFEPHPDERAKRRTRARGPPRRLPAPVGAALREASWTP